jgi:acetoin utilization deacetylase AcuC-like enzyme
MKLYFSETQLAHQPQQYMVHGRIVDPFENPNRAPALIAALQPLGFELADPGDHGRSAILSIHANHYVDFLETAYPRFAALPHRGPEVLPNVHPYIGAGPDLGGRGRPRPTGIIGQAGWYMGDMSCATMEGTFGAAYASAQAAIAGAKEVLAGATCFALCRPPGHHAYQDRASGFCYLNNAAIAAQFLRRTFKRVAISDFDTHHGDGTQAIFFARDDVFYGSVHTDPSSYYPHFLGYADEIGTGAGEGANRNLPLVQGAGDAKFVEANRALAKAVEAYGAEALVVSAGWDAHEDDPLSKLLVTTDAFSRIGEVWGKLALPTLIVQEGGYSLEAAGKAAPAFFAAFRSAHPG